MNRTFGAAALLMAALSAAALPAATLPAIGRGHRAQ
jgi:hypothetical protein